MLKMAELGTARQMPENPKLFTWQTLPGAKGHPRSLHWTQTLRLTLVTTNSSLFTFQRDAASSHEEPDSCCFAPYTKKSELHRLEKNPRSNQ